jgi:glyoxalase family protein
MKFPILGLHHVTATVDDAQADIDFSVDALGLRLVKKTVNFDNHGVYHFYYGDERGTPGTIWTTFPYADRGVAVGEKGAGQVTVTSFSVPAASLDTWRKRLRERNFAVTDMPARFGEESVRVIDPSGLVMELVGTNRDTRQPWVGSGLTPHDAVRGLHSVTMTVRDPAPTIAFMNDLLGFEVVNEAEGRTRVAVNGDEPGKTIDIVHAPDLASARNGLGTVHHVAMAITDGDEQRRLRDEIIRRGLQVTPVMDRQYFTSIYFREPGGVLFEVATMRPGFAIDEPVGALGTSLKLPPAAEPNRATIEKQLPAIHVAAR